MEIIIAVIGGSGFLGQHIVREFQQREAEDGSKSAVLKKYSIKEIRILDTHPFNPVVGIAKTPKVTYKKCDITKKEDLIQALNGVTSVIHCAAFKCSIFYSHEYNNKLGHEVNVKGTMNVIAACKQVGVSTLVYTSTIASVMSGKMIVDHTETITPSVEEDKLIFGDYARQRREAEREVVKTNYSKTKKGKLLKTVVMQPFLVYGEGDDYFMSEAIDYAKSNGGIFPSIGHNWALYQLAYAGNIAYGHVLALENLLQDFTNPIDSCAGLTVYITDDNDIDSPGNLLATFLNPLGIDVEDSNSIPLLLFFKIKIMSMFSRLRDFVGFPVHWKNYIVLQERLFNGCVVSRMRANLCLGYEAKYTVSESIKKSLAYYKMTHCGDK